MSRSVYIRLSIRLYTVFNKPTIVYNNIYSNLADDIWPLPKYYNIKLR